MITRLIYRLLEGRHYWRHVSFSEMAELYASRLLRTLAVSMVSVMIAIYLYQNGYGLTGAMLYFAVYFALRTVAAYPLAYLIARIGPKHATMVSNFLYVPALLALVTVPRYGLWALAGTAVLQAVSVTLYDMAYLIGFSKVKHDDHAGKELGYMHIVEQVARGLSPVVGGFIAYWFGPQATFFFAAAVFALAAAPLLFSPEPTLTHQHITFHGLPYRKIWRDALAEVSIGVDFVASSILWSLTVAIGIFSVATNAVYAQIGVLSSLTIVVGVVGARLFGLLVDKHRGRELLQTGVTADSLTHMVRPFVGTPLGVVMINVANEIATTAYVLPFTKALFARADDLPGYRIAYFAVISGAAAAGATLLCLVVAVMSLYMSEAHTLTAGYIFTAVAVFGIAANRLPTLAKRRFFNR